MVSLRLEHKTSGKTDHRQVSAIAQEIIAPAFPIKLPVCATAKESKYESTT